MLRHRTTEGWILIRHPDHAALAGQMAAAWGNELFRKPEPWADVVAAVSRHDDGWAARDAAPGITRQGRPSAFGADLVGKYTAFEEIDLVDYLCVRGRAMEIVASDNAYAAILISMHTCNLLTEHADRSTIAPEQLTLLDDFVARQRLRQSELREGLASAGRPADQLTATALSENFRLLQACDNLSLLSCVDFEGPASLLHPLALVQGGAARVGVVRTGPRIFQLSPWPFQQRQHSFTIHGRPVTGETFASHVELQAAFAKAPALAVSITVNA